MAFLAALPWLATAAATAYAARRASRDTRRNRQQRRGEHTESVRSHGRADRLIADENRRARRAAGVSNRENERQYRIDVSNQRRNEQQARAHRGRERQALGRAQVSNRRAERRYAKDASQYRSQVRTAIRDQRAQNAEAMTQAREGRHLLEKYGPEKFMQHNALNREQRHLLDYEIGQAQQRPQIQDIQQNPLYQQATGNLQDLLSDNPQDYEAYARPQMREYLEQTLPGIKNQFGGVNALSGSGIQNAYAHAATSLHEKLGAQRAELRRSALDRALGYAQQPQANQIAQYELGTRSSQLGLGTNPYHSIYRPPTIPGTLQPGNVQIPQPTAPNLTPLGAGPPPVPYQSVPRPQHQYYQPSGLTAGPRPQFQHQVQGPGFLGTALSGVAQGAGQAAGQQFGSNLGNSFSNMFSSSTPTQYASNPTAYRQLTATTPTPAFNSMNMNQMGGPGQRPLPGLTRPGFLS